MTEAQQLIETFEQFNPKALHLAEVVSIAVRVEPELLRRARLELIPEADAGDEADLWFSPLVQTSNSLGFVFYPEVSRILRERLARNSGLLDKVWEKVIKEVHTGISPALFVEEEIIWRALKNPNDPEIENLLRKALVAMINEKDRNGVAYWALRALPNLPFNVHDMETAKMLETGAHMRLGDPDTFSVDLESSPIPNWMPLLLPPNMERVKIGVRFIPGGIEFGELRLMEGAAELKVPQTNPLRIDVVWKEKSGEKHTYVLLRPKEFVSLALETKEIELRTISGEHYKLYKEVSVGIDLQTIKHQLRDSDSDVRRAAVLALVKLGNHDGLILIRELVRDSDSDVRRAALSVFGKLGNHDDLILIKEMLRDSDLDVRRAALSAFGKLGNHDDLILIKEMLRDSDSDVRRAALSVFGKLGNHDDLILIKEMLRDSDLDVRRAALSAFGKLGNHDDLILIKEMLRDSDSDVRRAALSAFGELGNHDDLILIKEMLKDSDSDVRRAALSAFGKLGNHDDLILIKEMLMDQNSYVKDAAIKTFEKIATQNDLHRMTKDENSEVRRAVAIVLNTVYHHIQDKQQAWSDLIYLTQDKDYNVQTSAANALTSAFPDSPDKQLAWHDLMRLMQNIDSEVRRCAANVLVTALPYIPKNNQDDFHRLTLAEDYHIRWPAAYAIGKAFPKISDKNQALSDLHRLTQDKESDVRTAAANALGNAFPYIPNKEQAWNDLFQLTQDNNSYVRGYANYSLGKASIFKATEIDREEIFKEELEKALSFFEIASQSTPNPAQFCLPFYRSYYTIIFNKEWTESQKYFAEAKKAVKGSKTKGRLLEAIESLASALKELQYEKDTDFRTMKSDLIAYRRYCERAIELLETVEDEVPGATKLIRKGLPRIDERVKRIIGEINETAKMLCKQTKGTQLEDLGKEVNLHGQTLLQIRDTIGLEKGINIMQNTISAICAKTHEEDRGEAFKILKRINNEQNIEEKLQLMNMLLSKISINPTQEKIEQILDKWGFRPGGLYFGKREEKKADIEKWLRCFEPSELKDALLILDKIQYYDANTVSAYVERLSKEIMKILGDDLTRVKFYPLGKSPSSSGGNFLYMYRKELGLSEVSFPYTPIDETDFSDTKALVFFDDMISSGNQAQAFAKQHLQNIQIDKYYVALLAFEEGYKKVKQSKYFKNVIVHELLSDEDRAFSPNSQIFPDKETRERIKSLCEKYGRLLFPKHPLGYDNSQALIVFPYNTPNNTLPIIWASEKNEKEPGYIWYPVWERISNVKKWSSLVNGQNLYR